MYHKGVTRELVIKTAVELAEEQGWSNFSMNQLAQRLEIRTASLYKHVSGLDDVITEIGMFALASHKEAQLKAIEGLHGPDAVRALANAYRAYTAEHPELYRIIFAMHKMSNETMENHAYMIPEPILQALDGFGLDLPEKKHWQRILRSYMHGFIAQEEAGYFRYYTEDKEETYRLGIECFLNGLMHRNDTHRTETHREETQIEETRGEETQ